MIDTSLESLEPVEFSPGPFFYVTDVAGDSQSDLREDLHMTDMRIAPMRWLGREEGLSQNVGNGSLSMLGDVVFHSETVSLCGFNIQRFSSKGKIIFLVMFLQKRLFFLSYLAAGSVNLGPRRIIFIWLRPSDSLLSFGGRLLSVACCCVLLGAKMLLCVPDRGFDMLSFICLVLVLCLVDVKMSHMSF